MQVHMCMCGVFLQGYIAFMLWDYVSIPLSVNILDELCSILLLFIPLVHFYISYLVILFFNSSLFDFPTILQFIRGISVPYLFPLNIQYPDVSPAQSSYSINIFVEKNE